MKILNAQVNAREIPTGRCAEVRGMVNKDGKTISFGSITIYDDEFDLETFENMTKLYQT